MDKKNELLSQTQFTELDNSDECIACEAFVKVFDDRLSNDSLKIDKIGLEELCLEVDIQYKDQVNSSYILNIIKLQYIKYMQLLLLVKVLR